MDNRDNIEYYDGSNLVAKCMSSLVPKIESKINIRGVTWSVAGITYAVDYADNNEMCGMRACVDLIKEQPND